MRLTTLAVLLFAVVTLTREYAVGRSSSTLAWAAFAVIAACLIVLVELTDRRQRRLREDERYRTTVREVTGVNLPPGFRLHVTPNGVEPLDDLCDWQWPKTPTPEEDR